MIRFYYSLLSGIFLITVFSCNIFHSAQQHAEGKEAATDEPGAMLQWEYERTRDPKTGLVPKQMLVDAYMAQQNDAREAPITGITWTERGPNNIGGRTRSLLFDLKDNTYKTVWAASVGGGLFKCSDITAATPVWSSINDFFSNIAISCLTQHPIYPDTMYFGTGETFGNQDGLAGAGIWRSSDNGVNWTQLSATTGFYGVTRLAVSKEGIVYAALSAHYKAGGTGGLYKSADGGVTWTAELTTTTTPSTSSNSGRDVKLAMNGDLYYSCIGQVWKRDHLTGTWSNITPSGTFQRIEIACAPSDSNYVYIMCQGSSTPITGFYTSTDAGTSWTSNPLPLIYDQTSSATQEFTRGQSWYDMTLAVQPDSASIIYAGAIDYIKSKDAGASYKQISAWSLFAMPGAANLATNQVMHSDHHCMVFRPGNTSFALFGNDGGIFRSTNIRNTWPSVPSYTAVNKNFNVTQFYSCAAANVVGSNNFIAGAQDNGSLKFNTPGVNSVTSVSGGDGCLVFIDQNNSNNQITSYVYNNYYVSTNASSFNLLSPSDYTGSFVNPSDLDGVNDILYSYGGSNTLSRWTNVFGSVSRSNLTVTGVGTITHVKVSVNDPTTVYVGTNTGYVYRIPNANTAVSPVTPTLLNAGSFGGSVSCIEVRKNSATTDDTILVTQSNYGLSNSVLVTVNGTSGTPTWTNIDNNSGLPNIPVNTCLFAPVQTGKEVLLGTELGIYTCNDIYAATPVWGQSNTGFANVRVDMLKIRSADSLIVAATHGRGLFTTSKYTPINATFATDKTVAYITESIQFTDFTNTTASSWAWDFDNNGSIDATTQNPTWAYGSPGFKSIKLTVNGTLSKVYYNYIQVLPNRGLPYTTAQGGDFESNAADFGAELINGVNWERGNSSVNFKNGVVSGSNAWVTGLTASSYANNNETYLLTPCFNFNFTGSDTLRFYLKNKFENSYDGLRIEYSLDMGISWTPLGTAVASNWYDFANTSGGAAFPVNQAFFNNSHNSYAQMKYSVSFLSGNKNVAFRFAFKSDVGGNFAGCAIDNFEITSSGTSLPVGYVETTACSKSEYFGPNETDTFYSANGKILAVLTNNSTFDYGLTTIAIDHTGTGAMNYATNTQSFRKIFDKTITVNPATNNSSGNYTISLFYDSTEVQGWKGITSNPYYLTNIVKCPVNIASGTLVNGEYGVSTSRALYGACDSSITASFSTGFSGFGTGINIHVLPVVLLSFTAESKEEDVWLKWSTASEKNNAGFDIEKSTDALHWSTLAFVEGKGTVYNKSVYAYTDKQAFEKSAVVYYRLRQTDFNNTSRLSEVRVAEHASEAGNIRITPQPAQESIEVYTGLKTGFTFNICDNSGKVLQTGGSENERTRIDIRNLPQGMYYLSISQYGRTLYTRPFIKTN